MMDAQPRPLQVLFLCTQNSARSQLAEALLAHEGGTAFDVASAGVSPAATVDPMTFDVLDALGVDWRGRRPKGPEAVQGAEWDVVITVCDQAREACPWLPGQPVFAHWSLSDPAASSGPPEARRDVFMKTARVIQQSVQRLAELGREELHPDRISACLGQDASSLRPPLRVLFLCTRNSARSQIAEALLARKGGRRVVVASAGSDPAPAVRPEAIAVLRESGIEWAGRPKGFEAVLERDWDLVITLCDRARESCPGLPTKPAFADWSIPDPVQITDPGKRDLAFRDTLALIAWRLDLMLALRSEALDRVVVEQRMREIADVRSTTGGWPLSL